VSAGAAARIALAALVAAALAGCGFAPPGSLAAGSEAVRIDASPRDMRRELVGYLEGKGVRIDEGASLMLKVDGREQQEIVSLTSTGTANKVRLRYAVDYSLLRGSETLSEEEFVLREVMTHNESRYLAKESERRRIFRSMRASALEKIWFRLRRELEAR